VCVCGVCVYVGVCVFVCVCVCVCVCLEVSTATELDKVFSGRPFGHQLRIHRRANAKNTSHHVTLRTEMELFSETFEFIMQLPRMSARKA